MTNIPDMVIRMELISYFSHYQDTVATCEEMAVRLGRDAGKVESQMEALFELNILKKTYDGMRALFSYLQPIPARVAGSRYAGRGQKKVPLCKAADADSNRANCETSSKNLAEEEREVDVRLQLMIAALKMESWRECLEILLDTIYRSEGVPCGAYLLGERCSRLLWDCQRGTNGTKAGMTKIDGVQNMVVEGELIQKKGMLDTAYHIKYLYPLENGEDVMICVNRNGSYHIDAAFLQSLCVDILPVIAEKRRVDLMEEMAAEKVLQDSIYWSAVNSADMSRGLLGTLACVAKSVEADRVSLLINNGSGTMRTLSTYGRPISPQVEGDDFPAGEGIARWCGEKGDFADLADPWQAPPFAPEGYDDVDFMLCCQLIPPGGEAMGTLCAVNNQSGECTCRKSFNDRDVRLFEGIARTLAVALAARESRTKTLNRKVIQAIMAAQSM